MALRDGTAWDLTAPANTDDIEDGDDEIADVRAGVELRMNKNHVHLAAASAGGEHLEGSARVHSSDAVPTIQVIGALDITGAAANVNIAGNEGLAEGMVWSDSNNGYILQIYGASAWHDVNYLQTLATVAHTGGGNLVTLTTADGGDAIEITGNGAGNCIRTIMAAGGSGIYADTTSTGNALFCVSTGAAGVPLHVNTHATSTAAQAVLIDVDNGKAHLTLTGDPDEALTTDGAIWFTGAALKIRIGATTYLFDLTEE